MPNNLINLHRLKLIKQINLAKPLLPLNRTKTPRPMSNRKIALPKQRSLKSRPQNHRPSSKLPRQAFKPSLTLQSFALIPIMPSYKSRRSLVNTSMLTCRSKRKNLKLNQLQCKLILWNQHLYKCQLLQIFAIRT